MKPMRVASIIIASEAHNGKEKPRPFVYIICLLRTLGAPYWSLLN